MTKKKSCQNVRVARALSVVERELYGWVDEEIFTQPSVIEADALPELRREMRLTADWRPRGIMLSYLPVWAFDYLLLNSRGRFFSVSRGGYPASSKWVGFPSYLRAGVLAFWVPSLVACVSVYLSTPCSSSWKRIHVFPCLSGS
ncbi:hypothetical protein PIB30_084817 [Stylosanthes scabra]|uniref:Uncharacterized protein n=1 Tax=Stylosanthes scabra TaxID=79078 RepID=A0ABU6ST87_9FABA|nr:hypothetical protein [Stylosanthes scabra]